MLFQSSVLLALAAGAIAAPFEKRSGVISVPVKQYIKEGATANDLMRSENAHLEAVKARASGRSMEKRQVDSTVENAVVSYLATIGIGSGSATYDLIVDTGSSNTWAKKFTLTSTSKDTGESVSVTYGSGSFSGEEYKDTVTLADGLVLTGQGVGRGTSSTGFTGVKGILGVGPADLTEGTTSGGESIPTVIDTAFSEGKIDAKVLGVYFHPTQTSADNPNGELTYGGVDTSKTTSDVTYQAVTSGQAGAYWGLTISSSLTSAKASGIVDTGTTLVYLPTQWFNAYKNAIPSAVIDSSSGLLRFPKSSLSSVPDITFTIGGKAFVYNKYAQLVESGLYSAFGLSSTYYYSWVGNFGESTSSSLSFILGMKFLERYYSVYDTDNSRIGFAETAVSLPTAAP